MIGRCARANSSVTHKQGASTHASRVFLRDASAIPSENRARMIRRDSDQTKEPRRNQRRYIAILANHYLDPTKAHGIKNQGVKKTIQRRNRGFSPIRREDQQPNRNPRQQRQIKVGKGKCQCQAARKREQRPRAAAANSFHRGNSAFDNRLETGTLKGVLERIRRFARSR